MNSLNVISAVQIDVIPSGGSATSREYVAQNVRVFYQVNGKSRQLADDSVYTKVDSYHLIFVLSGEEIDQVSNSGNLKAPQELQLDLDDPDGFTVELYPDAGQSKKFTVVSHDLSQRALADYKNLARNSTERIICKTKEAVTRTDIEWFNRY